MHNKFTPMLGAVVFVCLSGVLSSSADAEDGAYSGRTTIKSPGAYPQFCAARDMQIKVSGTQFALVGTGTAPVAAGPIKDDGTFSATFQPPPPPGARFAIPPVTLQGILQGATITGSLASPNGCVANFVLQKQ